MGFLNVYLLMRVFIHRSEICGISVAVALADMHECEPRKDVKKLKCQPRRAIVVKEQRPIDQPKSAFRVFM